MAARVALLLTIVMMALPQLTVCMSSSADRQRRVLGVSSCRAACVAAFPTAAISVDKCLNDSPDCYQCWDSCFLFAQDFKTWGVMCSRDKLCFGGCQVACAYNRHIAQPDFHWISSAPTYPLSVSFDRPGARVTVDWTEAGDESSDVVYAVLARRASDKKYRFIRETLERTLISRRRDLVFDTDKFLVVAVNTNGVHTYYRSTQPTRPNATTTSDNVVSSVTPVPIPVQPTVRHRPSAVSLDESPSAFSTPLFLLCLVLSALVSGCIAVCAFLLLLRLRHCVNKRKNAIRNLSVRNHLAKDISPSEAARMLRSSESPSAEEHYLRCSMPDLRQAYHPPTLSRHQADTDLHNLSSDSGENDTDPHATFLIRKV